MEAANRLHGAIFRISHDHGLLFCFGPLGFYCLQPCPFVSATMLYFGERKWITILSAAIGLNVFVYVTFCWFLDVPLSMLPAFLY